jgi:hypothetical protein
MSRRLIGLIIVLICISPITVYLVQNLDRLLDFLSWAWPIFPVWIGLCGFALGMHCLVENRFPWEKE